MVVVVNDAYEHRTQICIKHILVDIDLIVLLNKWFPNRESRSIFSRTMNLLFEFSFYQPKNTSFSCSMKCYIKKMQYRKEITRIVDFSETWKLKKYYFEALNKMNCVWTTCDSESSSKSVYCSFPVFQIILFQRCLSVLYVSKITWYVSIDQCTKVRSLLYFYWLLKYY